MAQTVVGFFKDGDDAQKALAKLESKGIARQQVDVSRGQYLDATADRDGRNTNRVTDFFNKLFGHDSDDAKRYSTVGQTNVTIVTVHAPSRDLAEEAADVLDDCGALDVDEQGSASRESDRGRTESLGDTSSGSDQRNLSRESESGGTGLRNTGTNNRWRSRIIDGSVEDNYRLRGE